MSSEYEGVTTRFLRDDERLMTSEEKHMPLVIEACDASDLGFLHRFLAANSEAIIADMATYGAVLLRGFAVASDQDFEDSVLKIKGFTGMSNAFMSEEGRIPAGTLKYVLQTNAVYKTGGTLYLGGFHSENYYSTDVPGYICFCCLKPSLLGGETGLVNMEKIYQHLSGALKSKLEKNSFFVSRWLVTDIMARYAVSRQHIEDICHRFNLPLIGSGDEQSVLMYKPNVFKHPLTEKKSLQVNLFEIPFLNEEMRRCFMKDYAGNTWFWHRLVWKLPGFVLKIIESVYIACASFFYSPKDSLNILRSKINTYLAARKIPAFDSTRIGSCFTPADTKELAHLIRAYYASCLWQKGDILLVDNKKVMHAGMPGSGDRLVRAMIGNPLEMAYSIDQPAVIDCKERTLGTVAAYMEKAQAS